MRVTSLQLVGVLLIGLGIAVVSWDGAARDAAATGTVDWIGLAFPLLGAFLFALEPILATVGLGDGTPVLVGLAVKTLAATGVFWAYLAVRGDLPGRAQLTGDVRWVIAAGLADSGFFLSYYAALSVSRVGIVVPIMQTRPLLVAAVSDIALRGIERVTPALPAGSVGIVAVAAMVAVYG